MAADRLPRLPLAVLAALSLLPACATLEPAPGGTPAAADQCAAGERLSVGQTCRLLVEAARHEVPLPLALAAGDRYRIELPAGQRWNDWRRPGVDPLNGDIADLTALMRLFAGFKRMPSEPYMALGVAMSAGGGRHTVRVGQQGQVLDVQGKGSIAFFANDIPFMHRNNGGHVWLTVQRLAGR
jgi:hypothetical protein